MSDPALDSLVTERLREIRSILGEVKEDTADAGLRSACLRQAMPPSRCGWTGWRLMLIGSDAGSNWSNRSSESDQAIGDLIMLTQLPAPDRDDPANRGADLGFRCERRHS
jgi:hypothetical protein